MHSDGGFARTVAIKRLHPARAAKPENVRMLVDEARVTARVQHPNVVATLDVLQEGNEILLVLEYVLGESLRKILVESYAHGQRMPPRIAAAIVAGALRGVHAAHEARNERGEPLELIHRDLSPSNILVDESGLARVLDFGVAKARGRIQEVTEIGQVKGTAGYMSPEQIQGRATRRSDVFALGIVLWEALVGDDLFRGDTAGAVLAAILAGRVDPPSARGVIVPASLEDVLMRALANKESDRFATALEMAEAIDAAVAVASQSEVAAWVHGVAGSSFEEQHRILAEVERAPPVTAPSSFLPMPGPLPSVAPPSARPRSSHVLVLAGILAVALLSAGAAIWTKRRAPRHLAATAASVPSDPSPAPTALASAPPDPPPSPPASASAAPDSPVPVSATASHRARPRPPPTPARSANDCNPPYSVDARGQKIWKRQCF
jgi:serine/threonine-protein kinase